MGKRSDFERVPRDFYPTPKEAVVPLLPFLPFQYKYVEPCAGDGRLIKHLKGECVAAYDIKPRDKGVDYADALDLTEEWMFDADYIITNPPWDRSILHPLIEHFRSLKPTWLLFDADWMHTKQASEYLKHCDMIVSVGRVKWIPDSKHTGKDNCCWYRFKSNDHACITEFIGR